MLRIKKFLASLIATALLMSATVTSGAVTVGSNILSNPSFESSDGWNYGGIFRTSDKSHTGSYSVKTNVRGNAVAICPSKQLSVKPNTDYVLSGYVYRQDNSTWGYVDLNDISGEVQLLNTDTYGQWTYVSGVWNSGSNTNVTVRLVVEPNYTINQHLKDGVTGDVWFDDIQLCPMDYGKYSEDTPTLSSQKKNYALENSDITAKITTDKNKEYLTELKNKTNNQSWINSVTEAPLAQPVAGTAINWVLSDTKEETDKMLTGTGRDVFNQYVFTYKSTSPAFTLKSYWRIYPTGPVYHFSEVINNTARIMFSRQTIYPLLISCSKHLTTLRCTALTVHATITALTDFLQPVSSKAR